MKIVSSRPIVIMASAVKNPNMLQCKTTGELTSLPFTFSPHELFPIRYVAKFKLPQIRCNLMQADWDIPTDKHVCYVIFLWSWFQISQTDCLQVLVLNMWGYPINPWLEGVTEPQFVDSTCRNMYIVHDNSDVAIWIINKLKCIELHKVLFTWRPWLAKSAGVSTVIKICCALCQKHPFPTNYILGNKPITAAHIKSTKVWTFSLGLIFD